MKILLKNLSILLTTAIIGSSIVYSSNDINNTSLNSTASTSSNSSSDAIPIIKNQLSTADKKRLDEAIDKIKEFAEFNRNLILELQLSENIKNNDNLWNFTKEYFVHSNITTKKMQWFDSWKL